MSIDTGEVRIAATRPGLGNEQLTMLLVCVLAVLGAGAMLLMMS